MEERLPPDLPEEGPFGPPDPCPYDGKMCFCHHRCFIGDPDDEGLIQYCPRFIME